MKLPRRQLLRLAGLAAAVPASRDAFAQAYPTRPVRLVVPVPGRRVDRSVGPHHGPMAVASGSASRS